MTWMVQTRCLDVQMPCKLMPALVLINEQTRCSSLRMCVSLPACAQHQATRGHHQPRYTEQEQQLGMYPGRIQGSDQPRCCSITVGGYMATAAASTSKLTSQLLCGSNWFRARQTSLQQNYCPLTARCTEEFMLLSSTASCDAYLKQL